MANTVTGRNQELLLKEVDIQTGVIKAKPGGKSAIFRMVMVDKKEAAANGGKATFVTDPVKHDALARKCVDLAVGNVVCHDGTHYEIAPIKQMDATEVAQARRRTMATVVPTTAPGLAAVTPA